MEKFIVTGLHSAGKSAFIRSFTTPECAETLKDISQERRSTRFISEYHFQKDSEEFKLTYQLKSPEDIIEKLWEQFRIRCGVSGIEEMSEKDTINQKLKGILDKSDGKKFFLTLNRFTITSFFSMNEFKESAEAIGELFVDSIKQDENLDLKKLVEDYWKKVIQKIQETLSVLTGATAGKQSKYTINLKDKKKEDAEKIIKSIFYKPDELNKNECFYSGLVQCAEIILPLRKELKDYDFASNGLVLIDSYGLDHDAQDGRNNGVLNNYLSIVRQQENLSGVFFLGTFNSNARNAQMENQAPTIADIVAYNLKEKANLNIICIVNAADSIVNAADSCEGIEWCLEELKSAIETYFICMHSENLKKIHPTALIDFSINHFMESIFPYTSIISEESNETLLKINRETLSKINESVLKFRIGTLSEEKQQILLDNLLKEHEDFPKEHEKEIKDNFEKLIGEVKKHFTGKERYHMLFWPEYGLDSPDYAGAWEKFIKKLHWSTRYKISDACTYTDKLYLDELYSPAYKTDPSAETADNFLYKDNNLKVAQKFDFYDTIEQLIQFEFTKMTKENEFFPLSESTSSVVTDQVIQHVMKNCIQEKNFYLIKLDTMKDGKKHNNFKNWFEETITEENIQFSADVITRYFIESINKHLNKIVETAKQKKAQEALKKIFQLVNYEPYSRHDDTLAEQFEEHRTRISLDALNKLNLSKDERNLLENKYPKLWSKIQGIT